MKTESFRGKCDIVGKEIGITPSKNIRSDFRQLWPVTRNSPENVSIVNTRLARERSRTRNRIEHFSFCNIFILISHMFCMSENSQFFVFKIFFGHIDWVLPLFAQRFLRSFLLFQAYWTFFINFSPSVFAKFSASYHYNGALIYDVVAFSYC